MIRQVVCLAVRLTARVRCLLDIVQFAALSRQAPYGAACLIDLSR
jgi:hypothetical protein